MKNTAMHKCYYRVQPTNRQEKLNIELFCKFGMKVKVTAPPPPRLLCKGVSCTRGWGYSSVSYEFLAHAINEMKMTVHPRNQADLKNTP